MFNKSIFALLVSGTLLALPATAAQRWGHEPVPDAGACFYEYPNFQGPYFCARAGDELPTIPNGLNDRINSIRVFGGGRVIVYSYNRFGGTEHWIDYNVPDLRYDGWDDRIASARLSWPRDGDRDERFYEGRPRGSSGEGQPGFREDYSRSRGNESYRDRSNGPMTRDQAQSIVRSAYLSVLKREPDPASAGWVDRVLNDHWTQQDIERELRNSTEYKTKNPSR